MTTRKMWKEIYMKLFNEPIDYMLGVIGTLITISLDILLLPFEIIGFIIYKKIEVESRGLK